MSPRYIRTPLRREHEVAAALLSGALAAGVGVVTFYLVRLVLSREPLDAERPELRKAPEPEE